MKSLPFKIFMTLTCLILVLFIGLQIYMADDAVRTEPLSLTTIEEKIYATGVVVREETVLTNETDGVISTVVSDGDRVANGEIVARVFAKGSQIGAQKEVQRIDFLINQLEQAKNTGITTGPDVTKLKSKVDLLLMNIISDTDSRNMNSVYATTNLLFIDLSKNALMTGDAEMIGQKIEQLTEQKAEYESKNLGDSVAVKAPMAGYYVGFSDGLENMLSFGSAAALTPVELDRIIRKSDLQLIEENAGKIISDYKWQFVCAVSQEETAGLSVGAAYSVRFPYILSEPLKTRLISISQPENGRCVLVFQGTYNIKELSLVRNQTVEIIKNTFSGYKIKTTALRMEADLYGVYVVDGYKIQFKPISIVYPPEKYYESDFLIVRASSPVSMAINQHDQVVVSGRNLYNGKIIK